MNDRSWMYPDSPQGLRRMDYCNGVQGFINFATSIPINFTEGGIRCPCRKCENKKYLHQDVVIMHLLHKGFMENYQCWYAHGEVFVSESGGEWKKRWLGLLLVLAWMIVHGCIQIHPKDCGGWIIVTGFRVLLISQHLFL